MRHEHVHVTARGSAPPVAATYFCRQLGIHLADQCERLKKMGEKRVAAGVTKRQQRCGCIGGYETERRRSHLFSELIHLGPRDALREVGGVLDAYALRIAQVGLFFKIRNRFDALVVGIRRVDELKYQHDSSTSDAIDAAHNKRDALWRRSAVLRPAQSPPGMQSCRRTGRIAT